ncbi:MAG: polymer-forming cytoskeletal protein [Ignavibacteria bacterium]|nr:polymer-forming cytoskeletal protein [Ignavibacteria bacterium]
MKNKLKTIDELSLIAKHLDIKGNLIGAGDLKIDGKIEGDVTLDGNLFLSDSASIKGNINANNFECNGIVEGNIFVKEKLTIGSKSKIVGDIKTKILIIEEGAEVNGKCIALKNYEEEN